MSPTHRKCFMTSGVFKVGVRDPVYRCCSCLTQAAAQKTDGSTPTIRYGVPSRVESVCVTRGR